MLVVCFFDPLWFGYLCGMSIIATKSFQLTGHSTGIYTLALGRSPHTIFSGSGDNVVAEWDLLKQEVNPFAIRLESTVYSLAHVPENGHLAIGQARGGVHIVDLVEGKEIRHLAIHDKAVFHVAYLQKNNQLLSFSADGTMGIWDAADYSFLRRIPIGELKLRRTAFSDDGTRMITTGNDGRMRVWETDMYNEIITVDAHEKSINAALFLSGNERVLTGGWDGHLRLWELGDEATMLTEIPAHNYAIYDIVWSPDRSLIATASRDKTVKIWDAKTLKPMARLDIKNGGHSHSVNALSWNKETGLLVSAGDDRRLIAWQITRSEA